MKQEIFELIVKARESIFELQNYLFENHREYYLAAKGVLEDSIEHIAEIEATIDQANDEMLSAAKKDLSLIFYTTTKAKDAYNAPVVQNVEAIEEVAPAIVEEVPTPEVEETPVEAEVEEPVVEEAVTEEEVVEEPTYVNEPVAEETPVGFEESVEETIGEPPVFEAEETIVENTEETAPVAEVEPTVAEENIEFNEEELNNLLAALDSANFEAIFDDVTPTENVEVTEEVIYENETPVVDEIPTVFDEVDEMVASPAEEVVVESSEEDDIQALDAFLNETATDDDDAFKI